MPAPIVIDRTSPLLQGYGLISAALLLGLLLSVAVSLLRMSGWLQALELTAYDTALQVHRSPSPEADEIVLVTITEADIQGLARWPLTDERLATLLEAIVSHEPIAVGLDIFRDQPVGDGADRLSEVLTRHPSVVAVFSQPTPGTIGVPPPSAVADDPTRVGFANMVLDPDGKVRRGLMMMHHDVHTVVYSLAAQVAFRYLDARGVFPESDPQVHGALKLGQGTVHQFSGNDGSYIDADDGEYQFLLDFRNADQRFQVIDMWSVLEGNVPTDLLKNRIVLVGVTAESVKDEFLTPASQQPLYGVELHAQVVAQLLRTAQQGDEPTRPITEYLEYLLAALFGLLGALVGVRIRRSAAFLVCVVTVAIALAALSVFAIGKGLWLPVVPAMLAWLASALAGVALVASYERRERAKIHRLFSRFCSKEVVDEIRYQGGDLLHPGQSTALQTTIMFTDIVGFSAIAEHLGPHRLMNWLNDYASAMMPLVYQHGGIVVRLIGDAIMAAYGAPIPRTHSEDIELDARRAVRTALAMDAALVQFNASRIDPFEKVAMRIGIATGMAAGGVLGEDRRQEYNIHGDVVNIAARLEQLEKRRFEPDFDNNRTRILVTMETLRELGDEFRTEFYDDLQLRNLNQTTRVYQILGLASAAPCDESLSSTSSSKVLSEKEI